MLRFLFILICMSINSLSAMDQEIVLLDTSQQTALIKKLAKLLTENDMYETLRDFKELEDIEATLVDSSIFSLSVLENIIRIQNSSFSNNTTNIALKLFKLIGYNAILALQNIIGNDHVIYVLRHDIKSSQIYDLLKDNLFDDPINLFDDSVSHITDSYTLEILQIIKNSDQKSFVFLDFDEFNPCESLRTSIFIGRIDDNNKIAKRIKRHQLHVKVTPQYPGHQISVVALDMYGSRLERSYSPSERARAWDTLKHFFEKKPDQHD